MTGIERAGLLAHTHTRRFKRLEAEALAWMEEKQAKYSPIVSFSGGKDSSVVVHLANRIKPTPLVFLDSGGEHPLSRDFCQRVAKEQGLELLVEDPRLNYRELLELAYEFGENSAYLPPGSVREFIIFETCEAACERVGADSYMLGLREEESAHRKLSSYLHGDDYYVQSRGMTRLCPLLKWRVDDILGYIAKHNLPLHPAYTDERLKGEKLIDIRVGVLTDPTASYTPKTINKLKQFHPEAWAELHRRLPHVPIW